MSKSKAIAVLLAFFVLLAGTTFVDIKGIDGKGAVSASDITLGLDLAGGVSITYEVVGEETPDATDMADTISKLQQRVYTYSDEALVYQEGENRINVEIPGVNDANAILEELGRPGTLYFIYEMGADGTPNYSQNYGMDAEGNYYVYYTLNKSVEELEADGSIALYGTDILDANPGTFPDAMGNSVYGVELRMTPEGTEKFATATTRAAQTRETIAIYYDGTFLSVPSVENPLTEGIAQITGNFTYESADKLASQIRIGGLKLELHELHSKVVGAQLGSEAIKTSLTAGAIGLAVIAVFMIVVYLIPGLAASLALLLYTALTVLLLNGFGMTLTLPGIAGIILSIGMAVDANVIIFARIREELATGKTVASAIKIGFDKALSAIVDGNVTTLIAAIVLWWLGSGSVRGFAQTLVLGIALSMFTALFVTRWLLQAFYALGFQSEKWYGVAKEAKAFDYIGKKHIFAAVSAILILVGVVFMGINKANTGTTLNYSLDFVGGTSTSVVFNEEMSLADIESVVIPELEAISGSAVQPQPVKGINENLFTEVVFKSNALEQEQREAIETMLLNKFGVPEEQITMETISSTISGEMKRDTILAVCVAIVGMLIYIRVRFKDIRFGAGGVLALLHDVLVVVAFYAVAKVSVGSTFIACMLTIVGYSINATIVIFDRIRENINPPAGKDETDKERIERLKKAKEAKANLKGVINLSISQTLSRSIFTSLTTFIMVAALYVLGVTAIREFALPLMVGIACGTYSSVFLAGSIYYMLSKKFPPKEEE
ncbi:MAG: protein translocase subunit SecD [Lachnospiraceae bacterium]|nr:protein translocase subunit SecD [Lachnospiraceae bacterium]